MNNASARFRGEVGRSQPIVDLPKQVPAPEGQLSLWADFAAADAQGVPLYLVNQTNDAKSFSSQDNDLYIKLEFKNAEGRWQRAQAHLSSWCGNSYYPVALPARQFFLFRGYRPQRGAKQTVRYATKDATLTSNESEGSVSDADLDAVSLDSLTAAEIPWSIRRQLESREDRPLSEMSSLRVRTEAVRMLAYYPRNLPALRDVEALRNKLDAEPPSPERDGLIKAIEDLLAHQNDPKPDPEQLVRLCIDRIANKPSADPAMTEKMAWQMLSVPSPNGIVVPMPSTKRTQASDWKDLIAPAVALLRRNEMGEASNAAASVLHQGWIVDVLVKDEELENWLLSSGTRLQEIGASGLARRSRFKRLVELGWKLPGPQQLVVLKVLAFTNPTVPQPDGRRIVRQADFSTDESAFWEHCATTMPIETANALWSWDIRNGNSFNRLIHDPLRDFFKAEAERGMKEHDLGSEAQSLRIALEMLASWKLKEDIPILNAMLNHAGYERYESWEMASHKKFANRRFRLRETAKQALMEHGEPVPQDLVLEVKIPAE